MLPDDVMISKTSKFPRKPLLSRNSKIRSKSSKIQALEKIFRNYFSTIGRSFPGILGLDLDTLKNAFCVFFVVLMFLLWWSVLQYILSIDNMSELNPMVVECRNVRIFAISLCVVSCLALLELREIMDSTSE